MTPRLGWTDWALSSGRETCWVPCWPWLWEGSLVANCKQAGATLLLAPSYSLTVLIPGRISCSWSLVVGKNYHSSFSAVTVPSSVTPQGETRVEILQVHFSPLNIFGEKAIGEAWGFWQPQSYKTMLKKCWVSTIFQRSKLWKKLRERGDSASSRCPAHFLLFLLLYPKDPLFWKSLF